jgi:hypothetical protein
MERAQSAHRRETVQRCWRQVHWQEERIKQSSPLGEARLDNQVGETVACDGRTLPSSSRILFAFKRRTRKHQPIQATGDERRKTIQSHVEAHRKQSSKVSQVIWKLKEMQRCSECLKSVGNVCNRCDRKAQKLERQFRMWLTGKGKRPANIHHCGEAFCDGSCGIMSCGCIDVCRGACGRFKGFLD